MTAQVTELSPGPGFEQWMMMNDSILFLEVLGHDRFGNRQAKELKVGPSRRGHKFWISQSDRMANQMMVADVAFDPFRNGTLTRVDADQHTDPNTASDQALTDEQIIEMLDLSVAELEDRVSRLAEIPMRRVLDLATAMDVSHQKLTLIEDIIKDRYAAGSPQKSLSSDVGEPLP